MRHGSVHACPAMSPALTKAISPFRSPGRRPSGPASSAMPLSQAAFTPLDDVAHIIQVALTPVFLLSGIGTLINVFATRLARVADQVEKIAETLEQLRGGEKRSAGGRLRVLRVRSLALDLAVILGALGGAATCGAVLALFYGALRNARVASFLYGLFGFAIVCTIAALCAFVFEMLLASRIVRARVEAGEKDAARG